MVADNPNYPAPPYLRSETKKPYIELSLRPYNGRLFIAKTREDYENSHQILFKSNDILSCGMNGRFSGNVGEDEIWSYLVWGDNCHTLAHEICHVVLHVFERCGIDPRECNGEPFCYMLSQLMMEAV